MDERFPVGTFQFDGVITSKETEVWIKEIEELPGLLRFAVSDLNEEQLDTPYRLAGWTVRQVIHHLVDSHMNAYIRIKLALTEDNPAIKPYDEGKWAELSDYIMPKEISLSLLEFLHIRWVHLLRSLEPIQLAKTFLHPESGEVTVGKCIGLYAWHGRHHLAHITTLRNNMNW